MPNFVGQFFSFFFMILVLLHESDLYHIIMFCWF